MEIIQNKDGNTLSIAVVGCLDTTTSPDLLTVFESGLDGVSELKLDFAKLDYISSAGFRVLLMANKRMTANSGTMSISGVNQAVREVFDMTGFSDIFNLV